MERFILFYFFFSFVITIYSQDNLKQERFLLPKNTVTLLFAGDTHFMWGVKDLQNQKGIHFPVEKIAPLFHNVDFRALNIETVIASEGKSKNFKTYVFQSSPDAFKVLNYLKIDLGFLGNNHSYDLEEPGLKDMLEHFRSEGIVAIGAEMDEDRAIEPAIFQIKNIKFAFYSLSLIGPETIFAKNNKAGVASPTNKFYNSLSSIRKNVDYVIVSLHWGNEYNLFPTQFQRNLADTLLKKGVDFIIGHHPHIPQAIDLRNNKAIIYSLGNFLFGSANYLQNHNILVILHFHLENKKFIGIEVIPISGIYRKYGYQLQYPNHEDIIHLFQEIYVLSMKENKNQKIYINNQIDKLYFIAQD